MDPNWLSNHVLTTLGVRRFTPVFVVCVAGVLQARSRDAQLRRIQAARGLGVRHVQHHRRRNGESPRILLGWRYTSCITCTLPPLLSAVAVPYLTSRRDGSALFNNSADMSFFFGRCLPRIDPHCVGTAMQHSAMQYLAFVAILMFVLAGQVKLPSSAPRHSTIVKVPAQCQLLDLCLTPRCPRCVRCFVSWGNRHRRRCLTAAGSLEGWCLSSSSPRR